MIANWRKWALWIWLIAAAVWVVLSWAFFYTRYLMLVSEVTEIACGYPNTHAPGYDACLKSPRSQHALASIPSWILRHDWIAIILPPLLVFIIGFVVIRATRPRPTPASS